MDVRSDALALRSETLSSVSASIRTGALLACFLLLPSLGLVQKYLGTAAAFVFAGAGTILLMWIAGRPWLTTAPHLKDQRWISWTIVLLFAIIAAAFLTLYPLTNTHTGPAASYDPMGGGSDRDESLKLGVRELLAGRYPYYQTTQLGNFVTQLPGSLLLAVPFALLGNAIWQNLFWFAAFLAVVRYAFGHDRAAVVFIVLTVFASPVVLQDFVTGGDLGVNAIMIMIGMFLVVRSTSDPSVAMWKNVAGVAFLGIALSSRLNYLLLLPPFGAAVARRAGVKRAVTYVGIITLTFGLITLPFYLYDPAGFAPLYLHNKFSMFDGELAHAGLLMPVLSVLSSIALATYPGNRTVGGWLIQSGLVLTMPVVLLMALASTRAGGPNFMFADYAAAGVFFGVIGVGYSGSG